MLRDACAGVPAVWARSLRVFVYACAAGGTRPLWPWEDHCARLALDGQDALPCTALAFCLTRTTRHIVAPVKPDVRVSRT